jgi:hypothetical protein
MSVLTIKNAWGAIPLCWYSVIDGRSKRTIDVAIRENQEVMKWYAERNIPVEVNESHQWSLRDAHDSLAVAMAFLAAYNARRAGVRHYVSQYMFNNPPGTWPVTDIAKMLAKNEMIESLAGDDFTVFRQVRAGLAHFSSNLLFAKGQLAASTVISLVLKPHIIHVVGYSEGDHAICPDELIESCQIVHGVLYNTSMACLTLSRIRLSGNGRGSSLKKPPFSLTPSGNMVLTDRMTPCQIRPSLPGQSRQAFLIPRTLQKANISAERL